MTRVEDLDPEEMISRAAEGKYIDSMRKAQESLDHELSRRRCN